MTEIFNNPKHGKIKFLQKKIFRIRNIVCYLLSVFWLLFHTQEYPRKYATVNHAADLFMYIRRVLNQIDFGLNFISVLMFLLKNRYKFNWNRNAKLFEIYDWANSFQLISFNRIGKYPFGN